MPQYTTPISPSTAYKPTHGGYAAKGLFKGLTLYPYQRAWIYGLAVSSESLSAGACPDEDFNSGAKTEIARLQMTDHLEGRQVACAFCRVTSPMHAFYRCRYCGVWYCPTCAAVHFGPDTTHLKRPSNSSIEFKSVDCIDHVATGRAIRKLRTKAKVSLREVAAEMGWSVAYQSDLELGRKRWTEEKVADAESAITRLSKGKSTP